MESGHGGSPSGATGRRVTDVARHKGVTEGRSEAVLATETAIEPILGGHPDRPEAPPTPSAT
jgi:hypothetical protein